jgi:hypothetical protein
MDVQEVLKLADDLLFVNTGKHLDNLQEVILRGTLQGQKYSKIAEEYHCTEQLGGLGVGSLEILREKGLAQEEKWSELIEIYRGNPLWLKIVATISHYRGVLQ